MSNNISNFEPVSLMEPMIPTESVTVLDNLVIELIEGSARLSGLINPIVQRSIGDLVRSMNCYYSNFIEGHNTHPRDIERALTSDFSNTPKKRALQQEAKAHIEVQKLIDLAPANSITTSSDYICWIHHEFFTRLPAEMLFVENPDTKTKLAILPGKFRTSGVAVGRHIPPIAENLSRFMSRFEEAYQPERLSKLRQVIAVAASHHRLAWIHPFFDGNGRVTRLFSHAYFKQIGVGCSLWSVSRGLARSTNNYKQKLANADEHRRGDLDGRGSLTQQGLIEFCEYFLKTCVDQIEYMTTLINPTEFLRRVEIYCEEETRAGRLPKKSFALIREAWHQGEFPRGMAGSITNYGSRQASNILNELVKKKILISDTPKGPVRLHFPVDIVERWFPNLYPDI